MRMSQMKTILLVTILLMVLLISCSAREVVSSSEAAISSEPSVSSEREVSSEQAMISSKESPAPEVSQSVPVSSSSQVAETMSSSPTVSSQLRDTIVIVQEDPVDVFLEMIDHSWYGGVYVKEDVYHILALPEYYDLLKEKVEKEYETQQETAISVDHPGEQKIYSLEQLDSAQNKLMQLGEKVGIVGTSRWIDMTAVPVTNGLEVIIENNMELTQELQERILNSTDVKSIRFSSGERENPNTTAEAKRFFRNEAVQDIYAFEPSTYTTVLLSTEFSTETLTKLLEEMPENTTRTTETERAFIVFTEQGRYYIYLDKNKTPEVLLNLWEDAVSSAQKGRQIQWLTHMTPEKITEIRAGGLGKTLTEREDIEAAAEFLKKEVFVGQIEKIHASEGEDNPNMPGGLYHIVITFDTGVTYSMIGYGDVDGHIDEGGSYLSIWTSDLDKTVYYTLTEGCAAKLRKFFGQWQ